MSILSLGPLMSTLKAYVYEAGCASVTLGGKGVIVVLRRSSNGWVANTRTGRPFDDELELVRIWSRADGVTVEFPFYMTDSRHARHLRRAAEHGWRDAVRAQQEAAQ